MVARARRMRKAHPTQARGGLRRDFIERVAFARDEIATDLAEPEAFWGSLLAGIRYLLRCRFKQRGQAVRPWGLELALSTWVRDNT
jgi:hypothetical protein